MYIQRQRAILLEVCKLQLNIGPTCLQTLFQRVAHSYDMRINGKLLQPKCYTSTYAIKSFRYGGAKVWNEVCDILKDCKTIAEFKAALAKWERVKCRCSNCISSVLREL